ncbi:MAG: AraC family transcriptional regulator [Firmicutes bacterium]|nr:AraC family transcriptional regulator [Bacillota bacterium]
MRVISNYKGKRSVAVSWLLSYIFVLLIPVFISCFIYFQSTNILQSEITRANQSMLAEVRQDADSKQRDMERISAEISINNRIDLMNSKKYFSLDTNTAYDFAEFAKELNLATLGSDFIEAFCIFHKDSDVLISKSARFNEKIFYDAYINPFGGSYEAFLEFLQSDVTNNAMAFPHNDEIDSKEQILLFQFPFAYGNDVKYIFVVNERKFLSAAYNVTQTFESDLYIIDRHNRVVSTNCSKDYSFIDYEYLSDDSKLIKAKHNGDEFIIMHTRSNANDWKYAMIVSSKVFWEKEKYISMLMVLSIIACLLIGVAASWVLMKKNYSSIRGLVNIMVNRAGKKLDTKYNEMQFLYEAITETIGEKEQLTDWTERQSKNIRDNFLIKLISSGIETDLSADEIHRDYNIRLESDHFGVILFCAEDYSAFSRQTDSFKEFMLVQLIITNIVGELAGVDNNAYVFETDKMIVCLVNFKETNISDGDGELLRVARETQRVIDKNFEIQLSASISNIHQTLRGVVFAYREALEAMEYKMVVGMGQILHYNDIMKYGADDGKKYHYPLQLEYQLINFIKAADIESSKRIVYDIFEKNFSDRALAVQTAKNLLINIIGTITKAINEIGDFFEALDPVAFIAKNETVEKMKHEIIRILEETCAFVEKERKSRGQQICESVQKYVEGNYKDPTLNITKIGEYFNITPPYLSKLFAEQAGVGLLDYIRKKRCDEAKTFLKQHNYTVREISVLVGFSDIKTFTRSFKKFEGITPGEYSGLA